MPTFVSTFLKITFSGINFVVSLFYDYYPGFGVLRREGQPSTGIVGLVTDHTAGGDRYWSDAECHKSQLTCLFGKPSHRRRREICTCVCAV